MWGLYDIAIAMITENCARYSIYWSTLFGTDDMLWEETSCDYEKAAIE